MRVSVPLRVFTVLVLASLACSLGGGNVEDLPPTDTPEPEVEPSPTPEGGGVEDGFFVLNLSESDQEGLELRAEEIYQSILNTGGEIDRGVLLEAYAELADLPRVGGEWQAAGPMPIEGVYMPQGRIPGSGRVNAFVIDPRDSDVVYAAASIGGLWKTEDGGESWRSLVDQQVPLIYGGLVMDPNNPDVLYALLGEFDGQVSSVYGFLANGLLKTEDAGATWSLLGAETFNGASVTALVFGEDGAMYAASGQMSVYYGPPDQPEFGIFKSTDNGVSWDRLAACSDFYSCEPTTGGENRSYLGGFYDLDISSDGVLFASACAVQCYTTSIIRSTDDGESWEQLDLSDAIETWEEENEVHLSYLDDDQEMPALDGFEIGISATDPDLLLAGGGITWFDDDGNEGLWSWAIRSTDGGDTWEWLPDAGDYCSGTNSSPQCTYDNIVEIDPTDPDIMYLGGSFSVEPDTYNWIAVIRRSDDGGDTWVDLTPAEDGSLMHPDAHGLSIDPNDNNVIWVGNDGGIYKTEDVTEDPPQWEPSSDGLNTLLFIDVALSPHDADYLIGGMQDNAKAFTTDRDNWEGAASGDGAFTAVDPFDPDIVYGTIYPPTIFERNEDGGEGDYTAWNPNSFTPGYTDGLDASDSWAFYPPFAVDPNTEGVIYLVSNRVYKTEDRGDSWEPVSDYLNFTDRGRIQSVMVAPSDPDVIYVGLTEGTLYASFDAGDSWDDITSSDFPGRVINRIAVSPDDPQTVYVAFGGFNLQTPDFPGHVFVSHDGGDSWDDLTFDLPDAPLNGLAVDVRDDYAGVYVGGALGVWVLPDGAENWLPYGTGMPFALVSSLQLNPDTGIMAAATYGRSVWVMDMP